jgi:hypothetical protein
MWRNDQNCERVARQTQRGKHFFPNLRIKTKLAFFDFKFQTLIGIPSNQYLRLHQIIYFTRNCRGLFLVFLYDESLRKGVKISDCYAGMA